MAASGTIESAAGAIGYREVIAMIEGRLNESELASEIARSTRALVRKQRTWFRTQLPPHRVVNAGELAGADDLFPSGLPDHFDRW